ncbi:unnamed protein product [Polarella glacialis]|uniref:ATP-dependent DNA helicase n=1 Tax=Polarella glacialis TaxID=89957 RepID=A0A813H8K7_POLGL|nr:unnamed protein product [Polarella glacialis]
MAMEPADRKRDASQVLRQELMELRYRLAREKGMSASSSKSMMEMCIANVFSDNVLSALVEAWPEDLEALGRVPGFSSVKLEKLGPQVLAVCDTCRADAAADAEGRPRSSDAKRPRTGTEAIDASQLTDEQRKWTAEALKGQSLFLTGEAGTGKSFLLAYIVQELKKTKMVACTASTGIVAASLGGCTIHSFAGVGIAKLPPEENIARVANNINSSNRWRETQVLVLDEVSMIDASLFTLLEKIARRTRGVDQPWGGLQLIVCGDFLQLPPVESNGFAFETEAWRCMKMQTAELVTPIRQQGDKAFLAMLSEIRIGICSSLTAQSLSQCSNAAKPAPTDGIAPTRLYCVNKDVDAENAARLAELPGAEEEVRAMDEFKDMMHSSRKKAADQMDKAAPSVLKLKIGAQVILTKNNPSQGIVNGTRGVIESWGEKDERGLRSASVRCDNGSVVLVEPVSYTQSDASGVGELLRIQLPLKLGWALTVHRAQGCTLSRAELQLENAFDCGQVYVALSRVKSLAGLWIKGKPVTQKEVKAHPAVLEFYFAY